MLKLESILSPVEGEIALVTERLREVADADFPQFTQIIEQAIGHSGKGVRPALTLLSGQVNQYHRECLIPMSAAVELLHLASLVHDDAIDKSPLRRGLPTLYSVWGDSAATIAGDYLFARSAELAAEPGNLRVVRLFARTLMLLAKGELEEDLTVYEWNQSRQDYFRRIDGKTAALFTMATESGAILSESTESTVESLREYGRNLGLAFQVVDDLLDFTGEEVTMGKPVGNDLLQGVLTLPAILYVEQHPDGGLIKRGFDTRGDGAELGQAIAEIRESAFIEKSLAIARELADKAQQAIRSLPDTEAKRALTELTLYVLERNR